MISLLQMLIMTLTLKFFWLREGAEAADDDLSLRLELARPGPGAGWEWDLRIMIMLVTVMIMIVMTDLVLFVSELSSDTWPLLLRGGFCGVIGRHVLRGTWRKVVTLILSFCTSIAFCNNFRECNKPTVGGHGHGQYAS